jgi:hypothetical protein
MSNVKKKIVASVAAIALGLGLAAPTTPASAGQWHGGGGGWHGGGGGWHGGGGGWHGGGWGGGGWRGGGWRGGGWTGGYYGGWGGCGWGNCWGPAVGLGVLGLAAGTAIASAPYYGDDGCWQVRPTYNSYGQFIGNRNVNVCGY